MKWLHYIVTQEANSIENRKEIFAQRCGVAQNVNGGEQLEPKTKVFYLSPRTLLLRERRLLILAFGCVISNNAFTAQ